MSMQNITLILTYPFFSLLCPVVLCECRFVTSSLHVKVHMFIFWVRRHVSVQNKQIYRNPRLLCRVIQSL